MSAFGTITVNSKNFVPTIPGTYVIDTSLYNGPQNFFKLSGGKRANKTAPVTFSITRVFEKDFDIGSGELQRRKLTVSVQISCADGFTGLEIDGLISDIDSFSTSGNINGMLLGKS